MGSERRCQLCPRGASSLGGDTLSPQMASKEKKKLPSRICYVEGAGDARGRRGACPGLWRGRSHTPSLPWDVPAVGTFPQMDLLPGRCTEPTQSQEFRPIPAATVRSSPPQPQCCCCGPGGPAQLGGLNPRRGSVEMLQVIGWSKKQGWALCFLYLDPKTEPPRPTQRKCPTAPLCFSVCTPIAESLPPGGGCFS